MSSSRNAKRWALAVVVLLLLLSIPSYRLIPFERIWSVDLDYSWVFHHSEAARNHPYEVPGAAVGDLIGRDMAYPPLLYYSFAWMRWFSISVCSWIWCLFNVLCLLLIPLLWSSAAQRQDKWATPGFWALLLFQFPTLFGLERGGTDVIVLLLWSLAYFSYSRGRTFTAGCWAGTSAVYKIYPVLACAVIGVPLLLRDRRKGVRLIGGMVASTVFWALLLWKDSLIYFERVLPGYASLGRALMLYSHHWRALAPDSPATRVLCLVIVGVWMLASYRQLLARPEFAFAGALAMSTFIALVSFDYNLVTIYPLLLVMFWQAWDAAGFSKQKWALLALTCFSFETSRQLFANVSYGPVYHVALELAVIISIALYAIRSETTAHALGANAVGQNESLPGI